MRKREFGQVVKNSSILPERDVDGVVTVRRMVQYTYEQEVGAEEKSQPVVLLGVGRYKIRTRAVRN